MKGLINTLGGAALCGMLASTVFAENPHSGGATGQPNQSCDVTMVTPGNAANARGSAFNPNGVSGAVYANPTSQGGISSGNSHVVAQYDVACFQQTARVGGLNAGGLGGTISGVGGTVGHGGGHH